MHRRLTLASGEALSNDPLLDLRDRGLVGNFEINGTDVAPPRCLPDR